MYTVNDIYKFLCSEYPLELQMSFDNSGLQLGRMDTEISKIMLALDMSPSVLEEALSVGAQLIITHHPLIFSSIKCIDDEKMLTLIENKIALISMHTNLDIAHDGVNDVLINLLGADSESSLDEYGCGRIGTLKHELSMDEFLSHCKNMLQTKGLRYYNCSKNVSRLAVMGGSGGDCVALAYAKGCDTYVTADVKYHQFLEAQELGINLIDADHFCTENPVIYMLAEKLNKKFFGLDICISENHKQIIDFC